MYVCVQVFPENRCIVKRFRTQTKKHYRRYLLCTLPFIRRTAVKTQETFVTRIRLPLPQPQTSRKPLPTTTFVPSMPTVFGKRQTSSSRMFSRWTATTTTPTTRTTGSRRKPSHSGCQTLPLLPPTAATIMQAKGKYSARPPVSRLLPNSPLHGCSHAQGDEALHSQSPAVLRRERPGRRTVSLWGFGGSLLAGWQPPLHEVPGAIHRLQSPHSATPNYSRFGRVRSGLERKLQSRKAISHQSITGSCFSSAQRTTPTSDKQRFLQGRCKENLPTPMQRNTYAIRKITGSNPNSWRLADAKHFWIRSWKKQNEHWK